MAEPGSGIIVLTAPSGAGKTTIARHVLEALPRIRFSVSATTRPPREGEVHGEDYYFLSEDEFRRLIQEDALLEYEEVYPGRFYGTLRRELADATPEEPVLLDIDVKGALNVKEAFGDDALVCFVAPPSKEELARRLRGRGTESDEALDERLARADMEMEAAARCDTVIVNDDLDTAVEETLNAIHQFLGIATPNNHAAD
jgi:guanylate kinase